MSGSVRTLTAAVLPLALAASALAACAPADRRGAEAPAATHTTMTALPPAIAELLALDAALDAAQAQTRPARTCRTTVDPVRRQLRRTIDVRTPDGATRVVFVRAAPSDSSLQRVEVIHKPAGGAQTGVTWSASDDAVRVVRYAAPGAASDSAAAGARYDPAALASRLRDVGRRALALPCTTDDGNR